MIFLKGGSSLQNILTSSRRLRRSAFLSVMLLMAIAVSVGILSVRSRGASADESTVTKLAVSPVIGQSPGTPVVATSVGRSLDGHQVLNDPACGGRIVNNSYVSPSPRSRFGESVVYSTDDLAGPIAVFGFARKGVTSFPSEGVVAQPLSFSDGSGTVQWLVDSRPFALLSVKRMDEVTLRKLADAILVGATEKIGFHQVELSPEGVSVELSTCMTTTGFIGIEVVRGQRSAELAYLLDVDPTRVVEFDDALVVEADRRGGSAAAQTRSASDDEWDSLVAATRLAGGE